jgi:BirA family biotin operon repressor/biotin-[acetyl-CoA-carboxylase] ligase
MALDVVRVRERLPGREVVWLETTGSTMADAAQLAAAGCPDGTVVVAEEQTAGEGRQGRRWHSEKGAGLYVSIVLRPVLPAESLLTLALALGLAAREAILEATGISCELKWPNDLLAGGRKCAGILAQRTPEAVIAGIGINVNQESFPAELGGRATSLRMQSGRVESREDLLVNLLLSADKHMKLLHEEGSRRIIAMYARACRRGGNHAAGA